MISSAPTRGAGRGTKLQQEGRKKFKTASTFVKTLFAADCEFQNIYSAIAKHKNMINAFNAARSDYLTPMTLLSIKVTEGKKRVARGLEITLGDNYKPREMKVTIMTASHDIVSKGKGFFLWGQKCWRYPLDDIVVDSKNLVCIETVDRWGRKTKFEMYCQDKEVRKGGKWVWFPDED